MSSADKMYGPIMTLRRDNRLLKYIPWSAFKMVDLDWMRVTDARDILEVSIFFIHFSVRANKEDRTRIEFSNTSPMKRSQLSGVHLLRLRNFKLLGRAENMLCTRMCSLMVSKMLESTTPASMRSRALSWHSVSIRIQFQDQY
jgi:hypothetical protein